MHEAPWKRGDEGASEEDRQKEMASTIHILSLHARPVRLDLLGLVLKSDETSLTLDAEAGPGKLLGTLAGQLVRVLDQLNLQSVVDEFAGEAGGTFKSFAHLASGKKLEQGMELGKILGVLAGRRIKGVLRHAVPGRGDEAERAHT